MKQLTEFVGPVFLRATEAAEKVCATIVTPEFARAKRASSSQTAPASVALEATPADDTTTEAAAEPATQTAVYNDTHISTLSPDTRQSIEKVIEEATGLKEDRLMRMVDTVLLFAAKAKKIRLIRVFKADDAPKGVERLGDFAFLVDYILLPHKEPKKGGKNHHGHKKEHNNKREHQAAHVSAAQLESGAQGAIPLLSGRFSMDAVAEDRKKRLASRDDANGGGKKRFRSQKPGGAPRNRRPERADGKPANSRGPRGPQIERTHAPAAKAHIQETPKSTS